MTNASASARVGRAERDACCLSCHRRFACGPADPFPSSLRPYTAFITWLSAVHIRRIPLFILAHFLSVHLSSGVLTLKCDNYVLHRSVRSQGKQATKYQHSPTNMAASIPSAPREESFLVRAGTLRIQVKRWGKKGGVPILALHGWLDNANTFDRLIPYLLAHHNDESGVGLDIIAPDFAGHGRSAHRHPQSDYLPNKWAEDSIMIVEQLGWTRFALLGHSMGGAISTIIASILTTRITHLILIENLGPPPPPADEQLYAKLWATQLTLPDSAPGRGRGKRVYGSLEECAVVRASGSRAMPLSVEAARVLVERGAVAVGDQESGSDVAVDTFDPVGLSSIPAPTPTPISTRIPSATTTTHYTFTFDPRIRSYPPELALPPPVLHTFLSSITAPVLIILGTHGLPASRRLIELRKGLVRDCRVVEVEGGHHCHLDDGWEGVGEVIRGWLKERPLVKVGAGRSVGGRGAVPAGRGPIKGYKL
ncbi:Alpha/Beta hydrolase protein [Fimicolochytrium jonesii]|uniref:Alpha/Beta hydrolase protein n=1 Tax=Fimicolochytrium jonesii TaxID=1396493 RepID=UPI0022FEF206|nr:Alpha/Beta hydrolase protein [Fimicolochytrium jonesii]KAI8821280.1 Alpha/Beta hydrolase protein [Fimicolochytrium jonesii]